MIKLTIKELMLQKGMKPTARRLTNSGIGYNTARGHLGGVSKSISFEDMEKLCYFFNCTPRELFYCSDEPYPVPDGHPLQEWRNLNFPFPVQDIRVMNPTETKLVQEFITKIRNGELEQKKEGQE